MNQTAAKKNKSKVSATTILLIALLVIAALLLVWTIVERTGLPGRLNTVASTNNYELSENELALLKYEEAYSVLYYNWMYYLYGMTGYYEDRWGDLSDYSSNPGGYVLDHMASYLSTMSEDSAYSTAKSILVYCEGADKAGFEITSKERADAEANLGVISLEALEANATGYDMSLSSFLSQYVGTGVSKGDVEKLTDKYVKAMLYAERKGEELEDAVTEEEAKEYRDRLENKGDFFFTEYVSCQLPSGTWVTDDVMESAKECKTLDELKKVLLEAYLNNELTADVLSTNFTATEDGNTILLDGVPAKEDGSIDNDKIKADLLASLLYRAELSEDKTVFDEAWDAENKENDSDVELTEGYVKNGDAQVTTMYSAVKTSIIGLEESDGTVYYADPTDEDATDLEKWLFGNEGLKEGDVTVIKTETTSTSTSTTTTTYTWYRIDDGDRIMIFDTEKTKDGYYVELKDDTAPKDGETETDADGNVKEILTKDQKYALIEAARGLDALKEVFEDKLSATEQAKLTESTLESVGEELAEWFYSADREAGDYARITVGEGDDAKEYAVLFTKENDETWLRNAKSGLASERLTEWFDQMAIDCNYKADYEPATETETATETTTEASTETATEAATEVATETETATEKATETETSTEAEGEDTAA